MVDEEAKLVKEKSFTRESQNNESKLDKSLKDDS